ncbi:hypothetical protein [Vibrio sonorensis]|uniref:hypothetical protein n=1 Tax=Vibrio sonorensis TaxID=1004316 RepID=UPI0008D9B837|nr:hypothetical protein [Vibrio sonorensis]
MKNGISTVCKSVIASMLFCGSVMATPSEALINDYNLAAQGDEDKVEQVHQALSQLINEEGAEPLSLVYLGSTETLMGRDAFLPWNKMKYTEQGLATIAKGLALLESQPSDAPQEIRQGMQEHLLAEALAAATYTALPDMFNHFERGYDLFLELLAKPEMKAQHFQATSWIYFYAIEASLRAEDKEQGLKWLEEMKQLGSDNPMTIQAQALLDKAA